MKCPWLVATGQFECGDCPACWESNRLADEAEAAQANAEAPKQSKASEVPGVATDA